MLSCFRKELLSIISTAQETVYTVMTSYSQGSGFLYNDNGAVITNAHVVEGETEVYINTIHGQEFKGIVIGYSNDTDVAVIHVPDLIGQEPFPLKIDSSEMIGEKIVALGSPSGLDNVASEGYITREDQSFNIGSYVYENLYQITSPIAIGSSGGPLIAKGSQRIIAINSAKHGLNTTIGFSIPLYKVIELIQSWVDWPMSKKSIIAELQLPGWEGTSNLQTNYDEIDIMDKYEIDIDFVY